MTRMILIGCRTFEPNWIERAESSRSCFVTRRGTVACSFVLLHTLSTQSLSPKIKISTLAWPLSSRWVALALWSSQRVLKQSIVCLSFCLRTQAETPKPRLKIGDGGGGGASVGGRQLPRGRKRHQLSSLCRSCSRSRLKCHWGVLLLSSSTSALSGELGLVCGWINNYFVIAPSRVECLYNLYRHQIHPYKAW